VKAPRGSKVRTPHFYTAGGQKPKDTVGRPAEAVTWVAARGGIPLDH
jgi:hypothetical protein